MAEREAERQAKAEEELQAEERLAEMANRAQQRLSSDLVEGDAPTVIDLADKIAEHQARLAGNLDDELLENTDKEALGIEQPEEALTLLQQQERLMQQLMQQEAQRQSQQADSSDDQALNSGVSLSALASNFEQRSEVSDQEDREAQEALEREQLEKERLAEEALENELGKPYE